MNEEEKDSIEILKNTDLDINTIDLVDLHTYNYAVKTVLNLLEKKDQQIDLLSETLRYYNGMQQEQCFCIDICGEKEYDMKNCKERIKQYVEYKAEEDK